MYTSTYMFYNYAYIVIILQRQTVLFSNIIKYYATLYLQCHIQM